VALLFQALLFGDGGVLVYGANVINMAVLMPFVGYGVYRLIAGRSALRTRRRVIAAGIAGYVGINTSALATAIEMGIQPDLFTNSAGAPLYSPYHLSQTIPAMALAHLTIAGAAEAILTAGVFTYLVKADVRRLTDSHPGIPVDVVDVRDSELAKPSKALSPIRVAIGFIGVMVLLTPLGLLAPGGAFGEDAPEELDLKSLGLSSVPEGLNRYNGFWSNSVLGGYGFADSQHPTLAYILSAIIGITVVAIVIALVCAVAQYLIRRKNPDNDVDSSHTASAQTDEATREQTTEQGSSV
jgi:cobalt/nickel transport system permease protein